MRSMRDNVVDGAVTPHVLTCDEKLSNVNRAGEGGEEGGSADGITIAACLVTRVDPALSWVTHVETTNEETQYRRCMLAVVLPQHEVAAGVLVGYLLVGNAS